jgi:Domain of unknown function (DUF4349)
MSTRSDHGHLRRGPLALLGLGLVITVVAACGSGAAILSTVGSSVDGGGGNAQDRFANNPVPAANPAVPETVSKSGTDQSQYDVNQANLLIIKTGNLDLQVAGLDAALASASQRITALGGYASGSQRQGDGDSANAQVTYRIPAARWDEALVALRALSIKVLGEQSQTQDVTGQVVDLGARITNLQATEQALQGIMKQATKIADVLAVQQQLTDVRGQIEELTAQRKHLTEQAAFSTLTVNFSLKEQAVATTAKKFDPGSEVDRASASLVDVLQTVATAGIWFGIVWLPVIIVLGILASIGLFIARRAFRGRRGGPPDGGSLGPGEASPPPVAVAPAPAAES